MVRCVSGFGAWRVLAVLGPLLIGGPVLGAAAGMGDARAGDVRLGRIAGSEPGVGPDTADFTAGMWIGGRGQGGAALGLSYLDGALGDGLGTARNGWPDGRHESLFATLGWRGGAGGLRSALGVGIGAGRAAMAETDVMQAGVQAFIGVEVDLSERISLGAGARAHYLDGGVGGSDLTALELGAAGRLGIRF